MAYSRMWKGIRKMKYQIIIEGSNYQEVQTVWEEIQNKYGFYDNCVLVEVNDSDTIIDSDRRNETGCLS